MPSYWYLRQPEPKPPPAQVFAFWATFPLSQRQQRRSKLSTNRCPSQHPSDPPTT
ncbi:hypothetical protein N658DRAFT_495257 [Parathielavia hyrcaniae]|uniref:Uncharacterized protein n=1 Tax=Parathielavia hyrcaniae TaxID=113614 RepID=A0AAN6Q2Z6_9PEZI|nr:hypothetical protein N658DRAFT_495257 [Parathielavia hyrcaniae]